jgi:galactosamine-6-phosphate isomerase
MEIFVGNSYQEISKKAADAAIQLMNSIEKPLLCPASGDSPAGLYKELVERFSNQEVNVSDWYFVGLDEWVGMNGYDEGSCRFHLNHQLFYPLKIEQERICFFNGRAEDLEAECNKTEKFIADHSGIQVAIVGLGTNGHVAMNEPGTSASLRSHVAAIHTSTQQAGQKYFKEAKQISQGITLGVATLLEAKHIILVANGEHKAEIVKKIITDEPSEQIPGTLLRNHPSLQIYLDAEAAQLYRSWS